MATGGVFIGDVVGHVGRSGIDCHQAMDADGYIDFKGYFNVCIPTANLFIVYIFLIEIVYRGYTYIKTTL